MDKNHTLNTQKEVVGVFFTKLGRMVEGHVTRHSSLQQTVEKQTFSGHVSCPV